jgi:hypothetical protein
MTQKDSVTGFYKYAWDISAVDVGLYIYKIKATHDEVVYSTKGEVNIYESDDIPTTADIATAVWTKDIDSITTDGTAGDKLNTVEGACDTIAVLGSGGVAHTLTFKDSNNTPLAGLNVWLTTDAGGNTLFGGRNNRTNSGGRITYYVELNVTYYVWDANHSSYVSSFTRTQA